MKARPTRPTAAPSTMPRYLYGIVGMPLGHSMSPTLHNWGLARHEYPGEYITWEKGPEELADFVHRVRTQPVHGVSVTLPHKESIIPLLDGITPRAKAVGAVNTLFWQGDTLLGENTDVEGFLTPLQNKSFAAALVLGGGGACRAVLAGLREKGVSMITVAVRTPVKAKPLQRTFGCKIIAWEERTKALTAMGRDLGVKNAGLVINATPLGMHGENVDQSPLPDDAWQALTDTTRAACLAYDLVYNPLETRFLTAARTAGLQTQDGLTFFATQGLAQFRLWTGLELPLDEVRALVLQTLEEQRTGKTL